MLSAFVQFIAHLVQSRRLIWELTVDEFRAKYLASYLGLTWALVQPMAFILIIWFVFSVGLRSGEADGAPFVLWLASGIVPWFFFTDALNTGANSVVGNSFLVKRVMFRVSVLPIVTLGSALFVHVALLVLLLAMYGFYGFQPTLFWLQLPYYTLCAVLLALGLSWMAAAVMVFVRDIRYLITIIVSFGFWVTPILWQLDRIPPAYQFIARLNPMHYVVEGFRDSLIGGVWFWDKPYTLVFWGITVVALLAGAGIFRRLRPHFADVL
jgi:ABC-type polysaccharide/polyol phosphate export permease